MSRDSGWIVTKGGTWIPVAHNASVSEMSGWQRASFTSMNGTRRTAGRGLAPREWEISETVPYDWAQELYTAYMANESQEPVFFIPPMAAGSNYAPFYKNAKRVPVTEDDGTTSWQVMVPTGYDTDFFPVRPGMAVEFGGYQDGGSIRLRLFKDDFMAGAGVVTCPAESLAVLSKRRAVITNIEARWAKLDSDGAVNATKGRFCRIVEADLPSVRPYGPGGAWVTIDEMEINHARIANKHSPLVNVKMSLTECERV